MRVLLIRLRLIGDVVLSTPLIRALRRTFPDASISYLVERDAAAVVSGNPHLDDVIVVERTRGLARIADDLRLARRLRRKRFDVVIDMHGGPRSSWLTLATGAPQRIGYDIAGRHWMYTRTVPRARELRPRHSVVNQWDLLNAIDGWPGGAPDPARDAVEMPLDTAADRRVAERLQRAGVEPGHELIVVHVSASNPFRRWPEPAFAEVVSSLVRESRGRRIVLSSGPSDRPAADRIAASARDRLPAEARSQVLDFGEFDIAELRALVARSRLFIGTAAAVLLIGVFNLAHFSQGWVQWGYRFSLDFIPFLLPLVALGAARPSDGRPRVIAFALLMAGVFVNLWGVTWGQLLGW